MAVRRSQNWLNQQRVDVPHLKSIESAVRSDFDELIGAFNQGPSSSYVLRGFELNMTGAIGSSANSLQMIVADSALFHGKSDEAGTFFQVEAGTANQTLNSTTNERVSGSFTPSSLNFIGLEFEREIDNTTSAQVFLWNPTNKTEISKNVPLAQIFDYKIVITSSIWASNVIPISVVETDASNNVITVEDRRPMYFRLGTGGVTTPNQFNTFDWTEGQDENFWRSSSSSVSPFEGGDKAIRHDKDWKDAVMSRFVDAIGGPFWYSQNKAGSLLKIKGDLAHTQMTGSGKFSHADSTAGQINWSSDVFLKFIGSRLQYKINANPAPNSDLVLNDNQVAYLNLVRGVDIVPNLIFTNSSAIVTSVGAVSWTGDILAGDYVKVGSKDDTRYFEVQSVDSASQVTLTEVFDGTSTGSGGTQAKYAFGFYEVVTTPSTNRHVQVNDREDVPFEEDIYWLFLRADDGGATAKIYIKGSSGGELEQGEEKEISDNTTLDVLEYIGSPAESDSTPDYLNAVTTSTKESRTATFPAASSLTSGQYFTINSELDRNEYYVWANIDGAGGDPTPAGLISVEVALNGGDSDVQVAGKYHAVLDALGNFNSTDNGDGTLTVENSLHGTSTDAANVNMGTGFSVVTDVQGAGSPNFNIFDDENLTRSIKRLDRSLGEVQDALDADPYDEIIDVIVGSTQTMIDQTGQTGGDKDATTSDHRLGQDFQATDDKQLANVVFRLKSSTLAATGSVVVDFYDNSTLPSEPGVLLATSDPIDVSTLTNSYQDITFDGFGFPSLINGDRYYAVVNFNGVTFNGDTLSMEVGTAPLGGNNTFSDDGGATWSSMGFAANFEVNVLSSATTDNEILGPVSAGTNITIPLNSRDSNVQETYIVGDADLNIHLNGQLLHVGDDYTEVGSAGSESTEIQMTFDLELGDILKFEKISGTSGGGSGSASGQNLGSVSDANVFKQTVGDVLQFRRLTAGSNINIQENPDDIVVSASPGVAPANVNTVSGVDYNITTSDDVILASNAGADRTLTLPDASSATGNIYYIKKIDAGNTLFLKSVSGQTLDGVDIDATPHSITIQYESITIVSDGSNWFII